MTSLMQSKRTRRQAARQNSAEHAISDARLAFTQERPLLCYKRKSPDSIEASLLHGRNGAIRTRDPYHPKVVHYQAVLRPGSDIITETLAKSRAIRRFLSRG